MIVEVDLIADREPFGGVSGGGHVVVEFFHAVVVAVNLALETVEHHGYELPLGSLPVVDEIPGVVGIVLGSATVNLLLVVISYHELEPELFVRVALG